MNILRRASVLTLLVAAPICCIADEPAECFTDEVQAHVIEQYGIYGPQSRTHEYFGFIYRYEGVIASAITRSSECKDEHCTLDTAAAARLIPRGSRVLGEWHTHPHENGSRSLSKEDVRGARNNGHIRCYRAFFSQPDGKIFGWDPQRTSVPSAMASLAPLGNYHQPVALERTAEVKYASRL